MKSFYLPVFLLFLSIQVKAQLLSGYSFTSDTTSFVPLVSSTNVWSTGNDVTRNDIPIGFGFKFGGPPSPTTDTVVSVNSNGWLALGTFNINLTNHANNNLKTTLLGPVIAPLWDDLSIGSGGKVSYKTTGTPGTRIFTMEWLKMNWYWGINTPSISFQAKLYEEDGAIEFIYRQEAGTVTNASASIGINNASATDFWSVNSTGSDAAATYGSETNTLSVKPKTGQVFRWSPLATSISPISGEPTNYLVYPNPSNGSFKISLAEEVFGGSYSVVDLVGNEIASGRIASGNTTVDLAGVGKGIYFLKFSGKKNRVEKIVVE